jgi:hypothetical protein
MALAVANSGTQTATLTTEHTLDTLTSGKTYVLVVDTANLVNGETLTLRIYTKVLSGGTSRVAYDAVYIHAQSDPIKYSVPVPANIEFLATLRQDGGTGRAFPWSILSLD